MNKIYCLIFAAVPLFTPAVGQPMTQCPGGYITIRIPDAVFAPQCALNQATVYRDLTPCMATGTSGICGLFISPDMEFKDETGEYSYTQICALSE